ncbi:MAG: DUF4870 domain-containing protein [Bacillota bacterium]|nr:DUF4870 domain-containing protein [Bacillota bacterium]
MTNGIQLTQEEKTFGMLAHLAALAGFIIPFGNIIGPLVVWLIKKDQSAWVDKQGKESLNFQISITIYAIVAGILTIIVIGVLLLIAVGIFSLIMIIIATVKTNNGEDYQYPLCIRFIK